MMHSAKPSLNDTLQGITVLDFSQVGAGPTAGMLLGDLGADVIKIESLAGDIGRKLGPPWQHGESVVSMSFNRNKRSLAIDLKRPQAQALVQRMAQSADVVLESFRPGVMDRLGLGYEALSAQHPSLIYCSVSAYGQTGPWADKPGVDGIVQAVSGLMSNIGNEDSPPMKVLVPAADMVTGYLATLSIVAALHQRDRAGPHQGKGQHLDMSLFNSAVMLQQSALASYLSNGELPARTGTAADRKVRRRVDRMPGGSRKGRKARGNPTPPQRETAAATGTAASQSCARWPRSPTTAGAPSSSRTS